MDSNGEVSQIFNNNPQGSRVRGRPQNRWWNCVQTDTNKYRIKNWKDRAKKIKRTDWEKYIKEARVSVGL
jgi:hypothetical protein